MREVQRSMSQVFLKIPKCLYKSTMLKEQVFLFHLLNVLWIAHAHTDDVGCMHYISTVHLCDTRHVLYGIITNSFWPITVCTFLWTFYNVQYSRLWFPFCLQDMNVPTQKYVLLYSLYSYPNVVLCFFGGFLLDRVFGVR